MTDTNNRRFTYGDQFSEEKTPLTTLLTICVDAGGDRSVLQQRIQDEFFSSHNNNSDNAKKLAMNCLLSLNAYKLIELTDKGRQFNITPLTTELLSLSDTPEQLFKRFAFHILTELEGLVLSRLIENIRARGERVTLEYLGEELNDLGYKIPPNSTYISTMRSWLALSGAYRETGYEVNWDVVYDILQTDQDILDELYGLTNEQKYYLLSMVSLDVQEFTPSNKIAKHTRSVYKIRLTSKNLVKDVLLPLEELGLIETNKTTEGRGAKPHDVKLTKKANVEVLAPVIENIASLTEITSSELNRTFDNVVADLSSEDKHVKGIALELFTIWVIRLLGLRFSKWRLRHFQATGGGEVDVMAASDKIVYSRWQIQCKNQKSNVGVDVIAKEVGLSFVTKADIVMVITTSKFAKDAINYANQVTDNSRYYVILLEGDDIQRIVEDRTKIIDILNIKARRTFAKKELGMSDFGEILTEEPQTIKKLEDIIQAISIESNGENE